MTYELIGALAVFAVASVLIAAFVARRINERVADRAAGASTSALEGFARRHPVVVMGIPAVPVVALVVALGMATHRERARNRTEFEQLEIGATADEVAALLGEPRTHLSLERLENEWGFGWVYVRGQVAVVAQFNVWYGKIDITTARVGLDRAGRIVLLAYGGT